MQRKTRLWWLALAPTLVLCSAMTLPQRAAASICPICGGGWDDYWSLVGALADFAVSTARVVVGF